MAPTKTALEQRSHLRIALLSLLAAIVMIGSGIIAVFNPANAQNESYIASVGNASAAATNSTMQFGVTLNCRYTGGCDGASITFERPKAADGTRLDGPMIISLASGSNPAIVYRVDNANSDTPTLTFTRFDNSISQLFTVSWKTTDPLVIPGEYSMNWSTKFPKISYQKSDQATGTVTGVASPKVEKSADSTGNVFNGALRTFTIRWNRPSRQTNNSGATAVLVDQLPSNYVFKGFTEDGIGSDMLTRRLDGNAVVTTTEAGEAIYEYDAANHRIIIRITRGVDAYIAQRNAGYARVRYVVQVNGITNGTELATNTKLTNTVTAQDVKTLDGKSLTVAESKVDLNYTRNRPGTYSKARGQGEYSTTTSDGTSPDVAAGYMYRPFVLSASNPGGSPQDLKIEDTTSWNGGGSEHRYLTRVSLDPVVYNGGRTETYGATIIGKRLDGSTKEYKVAPNQVLEIPREDKIVDVEIRVSQLYPVDGLPESPDNGVLRINLNYAVHITSEQITGTNAQENAPTATQFMNNAVYFLDNRRVGSARTIYTFYAKLPNLTPHISFRGSDTNTNLNLVRDKWFNATVGLYANADSAPAHPEAFLVLPRGFTLGSNPAFSDSGVANCKPADSWKFEKLADYNGSERWRIVLKNPEDTLQPTNGSTGIYCYKLPISSGNAQAGTYDKVPLSDQMHNIGLWIRELDGKLAHNTMSTKDEYDVNSDGNTSGRWRATSAAVSVASTTSIGVTKTATGDRPADNPLTTSWVNGVNEAESVALKNMDFTVTASTTGTTAVKDLVIYDMLPNAKNTGDNWQKLVEGATTDYSSDTSFSPDLSGPVTSVGHNKAFTAWYTTSANPCRPELSSAGSNYPDSSCPTFNAKGEWFTDLTGRNLSEITAVRIQINENVFGDFSFKIPMTVPLTDLEGKPLNTDDVAANRAAVGGKSVAGAHIPFVGPAYARVVPAGALGVEKSAVIAGNNVNQEPGDSYPTLRLGEKFTYVLKASVDPDGVGVVNPVIKDNLPAGIKVLSVRADSDGDFDTDTGYWSLPTMSSGATKTLYLEVEVTGYGDVTNFAAYDDPQTDEKPVPSIDYCAPHANSSGNVRCDSFTFHVDAGNAAISGNVFNDLDWTGTDTNGDTPRKDVRVILNEVLSDGSLKAVNNLITDSEGNYSFTSLPAGRYTVEFVTEDGVRYAPANQGNDDAKDSDATETREGNLSTGAFTLSENEQKQNVDLGIQPLAYITGLTFHDVNNNGTRDAGERILNNVRVQLLNEDGSEASVGYANSIDSAATGTSTAEVNDEGTYAFTGLRPGTYKVRFVTPDGYAVSAPGDATAITDAAKNDATVSVEQNAKRVVITSETKPFEAPAGLTDNVDAGFTELSSTAGIFWTDTNGDGIRNEGEKPRQGVILDLYRVLDDGTRVKVDEATTDENGSYGWYDLPPGNYSPVVRPIDGTVFAPQNDGDPAVEEGNDYDSNGQNPGYLPPGTNYKHLDGAIVELSTISGIAFWDDNANGVRHDAEAQIAERKATFELYREGDTSPVQTIETTNGQYIFDNVEPGQYFVKATNLPGAYFSKVIDPTSSITDDGFNDFVQDSASGQTRVFTVLGGTDNPHIDGGLVRNQSVSGTVWNDSDNDGIRGENEQPRSGVTVTITDALGQVRTATTDDDGNYSFEGVTLGEAKLTFTKPDSTQFSPTQAGDANGSDVNEDGEVTVRVVGFQDVTGVDAGVVSPTSVSGRVVLDSNRDGVISSDEPGVKGVEVKLYNADNDQIGTATTDENGNYTFENVLPGTGYYVEFIKPAGSVFFPAREPGELFDADRNDANPDSGQTTSFEVVNGTSITNIDAGIVNFASISGIAFNDTVDADNGIRDEGEAVRANVAIQLLKDGEVIQNAFTNENGFYIFDNLAPGTYQVKIGEMDSAVISKTASTGSEALSDKDSNNFNWESRLSPEVTLLANQDLNDLDVGLLPNQGISGNVFEDLNRNGYRDANEPGIAGVTVRIERPTFDPDYREVVTDEFGNWFTPARPVGENVYMVSFPDLSDRGYAYSPSTDWERNITEPAYSDIDENGKTTTFPVPLDSQTSHVDAGYSKGADLSGIAFNDADNNAKKAEDEALLADVEVTLWKKNEDGSYDSVATTTTNAAGYYEFLNQPPGTYQVRFTAPQGTQFTETQEEDLTVPGLSVVDREGVTRDYEVAAGDVVANLDAGILDLASVSGVAFTDTNRDGLRNDADTIRPGILVTLNGTNILGKNVELTAQTNESGEYEFTDLYPGEYTVTFAGAEGAVFTTQNVNDNANNDVDSDVDSNGSTNQFPIGANQQYRNVDAGYVVDANIAGSVWLDSNNNGRWDDGELPYQGLEVQIFLLESEDGVEGNNWITQATTGEMGHYEILNVPAGTYKVRFVTPEGYVFSPKTGTAVSESGLSYVNPDGDNAGLTDEFSVTANTDVTTVDAGIVPVASLSGMAFMDSDRDGNRIDESPREGVAVKILDSNGAVVGTTTTSADGTYSFNGLRPDNYTVVFSNESGDVFSTVKPTADGVNGTDSKVDSEGRVSVTVTAGIPVINVDAGYINTATISGLAFLDFNGDGVNQNSLPAPGVTVQLLDANNGDQPIGSPRSVDADGRYSFEVPPGRYKVKFFNDQGLSISQYPPREEGITAENYNDAGANGQTAAITVSAGKTYPNIDAGFAALGSISGTVFNDIDGDSLRGADPGVGGVTVELLDSNGDPVRNAAGEPITVLTDEFGNYTLANVPSGQYQVRFTKPDGFEFISSFNGTRTVELIINAETNSVTDVDAGLRQVAPIVTTTVTTDVDPSDPSATPTATTTLTVTETPTETPENGTITVTETVVVPPATESTEPAPETVTTTTTETATETDSPVTETITITPTNTPEPTDPSETPTVTVTVVVPPATEPQPTATTQTVVPTTTPATVTATVVVPPSTTQDPSEPQETPTVTSSLTVTINPIDPAVTPTETVVIEPTEQPTTTPVDGTHTVTATVVVPPSTAVDEPSESSEPTSSDETSSEQAPSSSSATSDEPKPSTPRPSVTVTPISSATSTAPPVMTTVDPTSPISRGSVSGGSGSGVNGATPTPSAAPRSGISGLAQTGANVLTLLVIAAALILIGVFLIRRKNRN